MGVRALAELSGIPHPTVSKSLAGKRVIDVAELARLCEALLIEPAEIFRRASRIAGVTSIKRNVAPDLHTMPLSEERYAADLKNKEPDEELRSP